MNLILLNETDRAGAATFVLRDGRAAHIRGVLNGRGGQAVRVGLIDGPTGFGTIVTSTPPLRTRTSTKLNGTGCADAGAALTRTVATTALPITPSRVTRCHSLKGGQW